MHIIIQSKGSMNTIEIIGAKSISLASNTYTITLSDDTTATYSAALYYLSVLMI